MHGTHLPPPPRSKWPSVTKASAQRLMVAQLVEGGVVECLVSYMAVEAANVRAALRGAAQEALDVMAAVSKQARCAT